MSSNLQYENVFRGKNGVLFARLYDPSTKSHTTQKVHSVPSLYIEDKNAKDSRLISIPERKPLKELKFKTLREFNNSLKLYKDSNVNLYGNKVIEQNYIRENWPNPIECYHEFSNMWFWDIETAVNLDLKYTKEESRDDWKPTGHKRAAMATVTSIQIYDTALKMFFVLALKKEWENKTNFVSPHGDIKYIKCSSEEVMLKKFIELLNRRDPAIISGWNSEGYDDPYITNRIIRVLDKRDDLYLWDEHKKAWVFNTDCLNGEYVKQLSPHANLIKHKEIQTDFGVQDQFKWVGIIQEDYLNLYKKYTFVSHTSYSLDSIAGYELGSEKVNHDDFADFKDFYENDFDTFIRYGVQDVSLLIEINQKLKLIDLAKFIAYTCGVTLDDVRGTIKQWNSFMFNQHLKLGQVLPLEGKFGKNETTIMHYALQSDKVSLEKKKFFEELLKNPSLHGQKYPGGITRGTAKFWTEVFSLDFSSLYPSIIQWANIGIETIILPKDLPEELLDLRAKYAIFYPKNAEAKDLIEFDFKFSREVLSNPEVCEEMNRVLTKYNVCMTPNGMFFRKDERSVLSQQMENLIEQRKVHKSKMKNAYRKIQELKDKKAELKDKGVSDGLDEIDKEIKKQKDLADMHDVFQMGFKILNNSAYGSLAISSNVFAGDKELFSGAVTSGARNANLIVGQANSKKISDISGIEPKEVKYGEKTYLDWIVQQDTDSNYISIEPIVKLKFGENYLETTDRKRITEFIENYINKVSLPLTYDALRNYSKAMNAYLPDKLIETPELISSSFISIKPKMYLARKNWDEGLYLAKPKLKVTGLSMVRANTPKFFREEIEKSFEVLLDGDVQKVAKYMEEVRKETYNQKPSRICINQSVNSLDYSYDEISKKWRKWVPDKNKFLTAPVNSRAALVHNKFLRDKGIVEIKDIEPGDKIGFVYMKLPNPVNSNVLAFVNEKVFEYGLDQYIDRDMMFEKGFSNNIKLVTDPLKWDLTLEEGLINEDEW